MAKDNRLYTLVKTTSKFPKSIRSTLWSKAFGRVVRYGWNSKYSLFRS